MAARSGVDGGVMVAGFAGRVVLDFVVMKSACEDLLKRLEGQGCRELLLSFREVQYLSSQALGALLTLDKELRAAGTRLILCHLAPEVYEVFEVTKLDRWFTIREEDSEEQDSALDPQQHLDPSDPDPVLLPFPPRR